MDEIQRFFMDHALCNAGTGFIKFHQFFQMLLVMGGGGGGEGGDSSTALYSVKLCVMINLNLRHNVL